MKIGLVLDDTIDSSDGVQQYVLTVGKWLTKNNHEVHYLVGESSRSDLLNMHSLAKNLKIKFNKNVLSMPFISSNKDIKNLLLKEQFDILHIQLPFSPFLAGKIIKFAPDRTSIIGTFHVLPYGKLQNYGTKLLSKITIRQILKIQKIIAVSPPAQKFVESLTSIKSIIIPNAVDNNLFKLGKKSNKYVNKKQNIVFLGRLVSRKGCLQLVKAIKQLVDNNQFMDCKLIIAGQGPERKTIENYILKNNLQNYIKLIGRVKEEEKADVFASADIVALPSISGESFGIVVVEAIASGAGVVIGGNNPGYSYVLEDTPEVLFNPNDTNEFSDLLFKLLNDIKFSKKIHDKQVKSINKFDINVVGKQLLRVYESVIANKIDKSDNN